MFPMSQEIGDERIEGDEIQSTEEGGREEGTGTRQSGTGQWVPGDTTTTWTQMLEAVLDRLDKMDTRISRLEGKPPRAEESNEEGRTRSQRTFTRVEDPEVATKRMLDVSRRTAREEYANLSPEESGRAFRHDFEMWEEQHFNAADKRYVKSLRDLLVEQGHKIKCEAFYPISRALIQFRDVTGKPYREAPGAASKGGLSPGRPPEGGDDSDDDGSSGGRYSEGSRGGPGDDEPGSSYGMSPKEDITRAHLRSMAPKPADVAKALPRDAVYHGGTTENIRRKYSTFKAACRLSGLDPANQRQIIDVMAVTWLRGAARLYWKDRLQQVKISDEVVDRLEEHFLHTRARRINEERWNALSFELTRSKQVASGTREARYSCESTLNRLFEEIDALADLRVSSKRSDESVLSKIIASVRAVTLFRPVCLQPPGTVEEMKTLLRAVAVEADNKALLEKTPRSNFSSLVAMTPVLESDSEEHEPETYYIDRKYLSDPSTRNVPGYGARYKTRRRTADKKSARNFNKQDTRANIRPRGKDITLRNGTVVKAGQCIVCFKDGCHSSVHKSAGLAYIAALSDESSTPSDATQTDLSEGHESAEDETAYACFVSDSRVCAFLGLGPTEHKGLIGMIVDTGASRLSTVGEKWLPDLREVTGCALRLRRNGADIVSIQGVGNNQVLTKGSFICPLYFGHQPYSIRVFVVPGFSPFLLSHKDMDRNGLSYHSLEKKVVRPADGYEQRVVWHRSLPYLPFTSVSLLTEVQLKSIHRSLGHAPVDKVVRLLEVADPSLKTSEIRQALRRIAIDCITCSMTQPPPKRFLFSSRYEGIGSFNSTIFVDVMSLADGNVLHVVCTGTGYQGATFLDDASAASAWKALCRCWLYVYCGAPDDLWHDPGTNFASAEFRNLSAGHGITVHEVPTEAHHTIGTIERKHATLRTVYERVSLDEPGTPRNEKLLLALRCVNDAPGPGGIAPTMLVFGVFPKLHIPQKRDVSLQARLRTIRECTMIAKRFKAQRIRDEAARRKHVPNMRHVHELQKMVPGDTVLVYREKSGWQSYPFVALEKDAVVVQLQNRASRFPLTSCRPASSAQVTSSGDLVPLPNVQRAPLSGDYQHAPEQNPDETMAEAPKEVPKDHKDKMLQDFLLDLPVAGLAAAVSSPTDFRSARDKEMQGLYAHSTFSIVPREKSSGHRLYNHKWIDKIKPDGTLKSRFTVQAYNDNSHGLLTFAPTIQRQSLRTIFAVGSRFKMQTRDVSQAFVQAEILLRRPVFVEPPPEMDLGPEFVLEVHRPLYGMPEAQLHWFTTYIAHHKERLDMKALCSDPCVLYTRAKLSMHTDCGAQSQFGTESCQNKVFNGKDSSDCPRSIVGIKVDDSILCGNELFLESEEKEASRFLTKDKNTISDKPTLLNGLYIWRDVNGDLLVQCSKQNTLQTCPLEPKTFEDFRSLRAKCAYVAHSAAPLVLYDVAKMSQVTLETFAPDHIRDVCRVLRLLPKLPPLRYCVLLHGTLEIAVCIDASFASNDDMSSQIGVLCMVRERETGKCNIVHFVSMKSKRVCRSVLVAELLAMIEGFDIGFSVRNAVKEMTGSDLPLTLYTDSQSLYHLAISLTRTRERRMQIDLQILREAYENRDITDICWISGDSNPADGLTKHSSNTALRNLLETSIFNPSMMSSIDRDQEPVRVLRHRSIRKEK